MPIPTGIVSSISSAAPGTTARAMPKTPISASAAASAWREPSRCERNAAGGANRPMHSTGIVASMPTTACDVFRSS